LHDWFVKRQPRAHVTLSDETDYATSHVIVEQTTA
jgi:phosphopantetheinyl transferase (holo-ACP synthase)